MNSSTTIPAEVDEIYRRRVLRARASDPLEKMWDGPRLFEGVLGRMRIGIQAQLATTDPSVIRAELGRRLSILAATHSRHDR